MERIKQVFDRDFLQWRIELPAEALETQQRGEIQAEGWHIQYLLGENSRGKFMDYLASHHMQGSPIHKRIYETGAEEILPSYFTCFSQHIDATKELIKNIDLTVQVYNRKAEKLLALKGFSALNY